MDQTSGYLPEAGNYSCPGRTSGGQGPFIFKGDFCWVFVCLSVGLGGFVGLVLVVVVVGWVFLLFLFPPWALAVLGRS